MTDPIASTSAAQSKHIDAIQQYVASTEMQRKLYKRTLFIVVLSQIFGGAGLAAGLTVGALIAQDMIGKAGYEGIPSALLTLGSAGGAFIVGRLSQRWGRRLGLASGFLAGGLGAIGVVAAASIQNVLLLFLSFVLYGAGTATNLQARYAGTDLAKPEHRAKAVSTAMVFTTIGAVAGPNLVGVMGGVAEGFGIPALAGPFLLGAAAFILAGLVLLTLLRPDPLVIAKAIAEANKHSVRSESKSGPTAANQRGIVVGATVMVLTQIVMIAVMTMTPIHMKHHGHDLSEVGLVIGIHIAAMFLPSLITGTLADKFGRAAMAYASGITLLLAGIIAAAAPGDSMALLILALALLGLGWNFGLISGTALIVDAAPIEARAKIQGNLDVLVALAGASGGALSGMVVAGSSFATLAISGSFLSLLLIPVVVWSRSKSSKH